MTFGSLFSGIGGFDLGFEQAGLTCSWQVENDAKCNDVLARYWPDVKRYGDVNDVGKGLESVDVICGGFPCQDVSVAGQRKGLAGERSGLWFQFHRILGELRPRWVVVENVPGLLSSNGGRDFATIIRGLAELGYLSAWRVLDAQYFGVAQRRRRVLIVGHLGKSGCAAEVLFEREGGAWDSSPSREAGEEVAGSLGGGAGKRGWCDDLDRSGAFMVARPLAYGKTTDHYDASQQTYIAFTQNQRDKVRDLEDKATTVVGEPGSHQQTYVAGFLGGQGAGAGSLGYQQEQAPVLKGAASGTNQVGAIVGNFGIRRLTPTECERLQGFPDGWTDGQSDSARYRQLGNAVCVPVAEWIGKRIAEVEVI